MVAQAATPTAAAVRAMTQIALQNVRRAMTPILLKPATSLLSLTLLDAEPARQPQACESA